MNNIWIDMTKQRPPAGQHAMILHKDEDFYWIYIGKVRYVRPRPTEHYNVRGNKLQSTHTISIDIDAEYICNFPHYKKVLAHKREKSSILIPQLKKAEWIEDDAEFDRTYYHQGIVMGTNLLYWVPLSENVIPEKLPSF